MPVIDYIDGPNRRIYLHSDTQTAALNPIDVYKEMRTLRRTDESLRKFDPFLTASGYEAKGGGNFTPRLTREMLGTRIVPYDATHVLTVIGEIITDDGASGVDCFDRSLLSVGSQVDINYIPPQVEIIELGTSGLTAEEAAALAAIEANVDVAVSTRGTDTDTADAVWSKTLP